MPVGSLTSPPGVGGHMPGSQGVRFRNPQTREETRLNIQRTPLLDQ